MGKLKDYSEAILDRAFPIRGPVRRVVEGSAQVIDALPKKERNRADDITKANAEELDRIWNRAIQRKLMPNSEVWKREAEMLSKPIPQSDKFDEAGMGNEGFKKGGKVSKASSRADGIAQRGKTRGKII